MSDQPTFAEILVSQLGKPQEPFDMKDLLFLGVVAGGIVAYLTFEYGVVRLIKLIARLFDRMAPKGRGDQ